MSGDLPTKNAPDLGEEKTASASVVGDYWDFRVLFASHRLKLSLFFGAQPRADEQYVNTFVGCQHSKCIIGTASHYWFPTVLAANQALNHGHDFGVGSDGEDARHGLGLARNRYRGCKLGEKLVELGTKGFVGQAVLRVKRFFEAG